MLLIIWRLYRKQSYWGKRQQTHETQRLVYLLRVDVLFQNI